MLRMLNKLVVLTVILGPLAARAQNEELKAPPAHAQSRNMMYSGCAGPMAFQIGMNAGPVDNCVRTIDASTCQITPDTCCFRQCIYMLTDKITDASITGESPNLIAQVNQAVKRKLQPESARPNAARPSGPEDLAGYYHSCIATCSSALKMHLDTHMQKRR